METAVRPVFSYNRYLFSHAEREEGLAKNTRKTIVKTTDASYNKDRRGSGESAALKAFRKLTLADRFIFYKVMQDKELCRRRMRRTCRRGAGTTRT